MRVAAIASWVPRLVGLWILFGATLKLFFGTPADLPEVMRDLPLSLGVLFKLVVAVEFIVGLLVLLKPSRGWLPAAALLALFLTVLTLQVTRGERVCGCFGAALTISPTLMLVIDGTLLLLLLLSRPWRILTGRGELAWPALVVVLVAALLLPVLIDREAEPPGSTNGSSASGGLRKWVEFDVKSWTGKALSETTLHPWLAPEHRVKDGLIVIWRSSCEVCADHLSRIAAEDQGTRTIILLQLPEEEEGEKVAVTTFPEGEWVLRAVLSEDYAWLVTPPAHIEVMDGYVTSALEGMDVIR